MKRLLILAYDFPPYVSVGGLRPYAWHKYLKEFGVEPIIVTRQWGNIYGNELDYIAPGASDETIVEETECGTIIRTPYKPNLANRLMLKYGKKRFALVRKAVTAFYEFAQYPFFVGPKSCIYRGAKEYLKKNNVDAIIATGEPFVLFKYASALSRKNKIPWIADYRDPWVQNKNRSQFMGRWNAFFERKFTLNAKSVITVSEFCRLQIEKNVSKPFLIIPNGYNPDAVSAVSDIQQDSDRLRFAFVGTIYIWHPLESVLDCFAQFAETEPKPNFEINFYGVNNAEEIRQIVQTKFPVLTTYVNIFGRIQNAELIRYLAANSIMLLFNYYAFMGTKIYDFIGLRRKILFCFSNDKNAMELKNKYYPVDEMQGISNHLQEDLIRSTQSGIIVEDKSQLLPELRNIYNEFLQNRFIKCDSVNIEPLSRKGQTKQLAEIIKQL